MSEERRLVRIEGGWLNPASSKTLEEAWAQFWMAITPEIARLVDEGRLDHLPCSSLVPSGPASIQRQP
jgi:hypothetical protein